MTDLENKNKRKVKQPKQPKERVAKESDERYTPEYVLDVARAVSPIVLDPCTTMDNRTRAEKFFCFADDGLKQNWYEASHGGLIFVNPPFSKLRDWAKKCAEEASRGCQIIGLFPGDTSTIWFQDVVSQTADAVCFWRGRIEFIRTSKAFGQAAMQPTMFPYWGPNVGFFQSAYMNHGFVVSRQSGSLTL
jgi:site-specific DNA-methyltransferase (adenine-specific)